MLRKKGGPLAGSRRGTSVGSPRLSRKRTVKDFTVTEIPEEDLDGLSAWKNFGGLSLDEAYAKFCECPEGYYEDFMWMGVGAFTFYFPVIVRYIREEESKCKFDGESGH